MHDQKALIYDAIVRILTDGLFQRLRRHWIESLAAQSLLLQSRAAIVEATVQTIEMTLNDFPYSHHTEIEYLKKLLRLYFPLIQAEEIVAYTTRKVVGVMANHIALFNNIDDTPDKLINFIR